MNLLVETNEALAYCHKTPVDVAWVGSSTGQVVGTWQDFADLARDLTYDAGYGAVVIASDLVIVFIDGSWLERYEYDGSESWVYKKVPEIAEHPKPLNQLMNINYWGLTGAFRSSGSDDDADYDD